MDESMERAIYEGEEVKKFLATPIGKLLIETAESEYQAGLERLSVADPHNISEIMDIQLDIRVAKAVPVWLQQTIEAGNVAYQEYIDTSS